MKIKNWNQFNESWYGKNDDHDDDPRCEELPECEKVYQKLVRDKKLERINETVK